MADKPIHDSFVVGHQDIQVLGEKAHDGVNLVRLHIPSNNMRGYHGRGLIVKDAKLLITRLESAVKWLESGDETRTF